MSFGSEHYSHYSSYFLDMTNVHKDWDPLVHVHTTEEIILFTHTGTCTLTNNGTTLTVNTPAFVWNRAGSFHNVSNVSTNEGSFIFAFHPHILSEMPKRLLPMDFLEDSSLFVLPLDLMQTSRMRYLFDAACGSSFIQRPLLLSCIFYQITLGMAAGLEPIRVDRVDNYIFQVISLLRTSMSSKLTVKELCEQFHVGPTKLKADFKKFTHMPIHAFRLQHQLQNAISQVRYVDIPLAQIAYDCGFADESHLVRAFKAKYGITPGAFRKKFINEFRKAEATATPLSDDTSYP